MLTKFGLTENELTDNRQLMLMPETDEHEFYDETIDIKVTQLINIYEESKFMYYL